jgi:hypothetical protein
VRAPDPFKKSWLLGIGLDNDDGHIRATRGENFHIIGGSHQTHQSMQEKCLKFNEKLKRRGKRLEDLPRRELLDLADECQMHIVEPKKKRVP